MTNAEILQEAMTPFLFEQEVNADHVFQAVARAFVLGHTFNETIVFAGCTVRCEGYALVIEYAGQETRIVLTGN